MLKLYRTGRCPLCDEIEERLKAWSLAHEVVMVFDEESASSGALPYLEEGGQVYRGQAISAFLDDLERELAFSRSISGDACYVDPDDPGRCM